MGRMAGQRMARRNLSDRDRASQRGRFSEHRIAFGDRLRGKYREREWICRGWMACGMTALIIVSSSPSFAQNWRVQPSVSLRETWTDNVALVSSSQARSDFVTELSPSLMVQGRGSRARLDVDLHPSFLAYARDSGRNGFLNQLSASGAVEAIERLLFVEAHAQITQQSVSAFGPQASSNVSDTSNRTETRLFSVSPYSKGIIGGWATYEVRYQASSTRTEADAGGQGNSHVVSGNLASIADFASIGWIVDYRDARYDFRAGQDAKSRMLRGTLIYRFDPALWLFVKGGRESNDYEDVNRSFGTGGLGLEWSPTGRTRVSAEHDKRFFGWGHRYSFRHRARGVSYSLLAAREETTTSDQLTRNSVGTLFERFSDLLSAQFPDLQQRAEQVRQILARTGIPQEAIPQAGFLTSAVQLERRIEGSVALLGPRNTWTLSANHRVSRALTSVGESVTVDSLTASEISEQGLFLNVNHRLTEQDSVLASASWQRNRGAGDNPLEIINRRFELVVTRRLGSSSSGSLGFRAVRSDGGAETGRANGYRENAVFGGLSHQF